MPKDHVYRSKTPNADGLYPYTAEEDAVWGELFDRQMTNLPGKVVPEYIAGVAALGLNAAKVPQVSEIDARLTALTCAGVEGVPAIIPPNQFFSLLSQRRFPVATFLRRREEMDYIEEPDLFHEVFGHCPLLTNPDYSDFIERFGQTAVDLQGRSMNWHLFRLFWFTIEFGMMATEDGLRAYGAGIVSSPSELDHALGGNAELRPFNLADVLRTPYRIDILQPVYFAIDSFEQLAACLEEDLGAHIAEAKAKGDFAPLYQVA